jgi:hypothetical protein
MVGVLRRILGSVHQEPPQGTEAWIVLDEAPFMNLVCQP